MDHFHLPQGHEWDDWLKDHPLFLLVAAMAIGLAASLLLALVIAITRPVY
ncbi:MAG: hypothetical protein HQL82_02965 [Magnetococcales bacterium]|nr:hypothetical protein [Magnetococcales bacterium]